MRGKSGRAWACPRTRLRWRVVSDSAGIIPVLAGAVRLTKLMGGPEITANNARFVASPIPATVHIVSVRAGLAITHILAARMEERS